jgi:hypothetical protein
MRGFSKWPSKNREDDENPLELGVANFQTKKNHEVLEFIISKPS